MIPVSCFTRLLMRNPIGRHLKPRSPEARPLVRPDQARRSLELCIKGALIQLPPAYSLFSPTLTAIEASGIRARSIG
jgi:hypothetical protein